MRALKILQDQLREELETLKRGGEKQQIMANSNRKYNSF